MDSIRQISDRLNWRYVILGVIIWWLVMLIVYSIVSLRVNHLKDSLKDAGIELIIATKLWPLPVRVT